VLVQVRRGRADDAEACLAIVEALPHYFTASTHDEVRRDIRSHPSWIAVEDDEIIGFVLAPRRFTAGAEITFAAVVPSRRDNGIGTALVERCLADLAAGGVSMVEVKTLDATSGYEPYVATRAFWERRGFVQIDCIDPLPGWDVGNPSAIYARSIP
jgi:ribosomal protein S18 acetylase RimI-like enzyme